MKKLGIVLLMLMSFAVLANAPIETGTFNNKAIYGYDPIAYWTENKAAKGSDEYVFEWRGAQWYFKNQANMDMFIANPEKFAPQYGGYCAFAMADDNLVGIDEDAFTIYQDKLYLNYSKRIAKRWREDKDYFIGEADKFYPLKVDLPES